MEASKGLSLFHKGATPCLKFFLIRSNIPTTQKNKKVKIIINQTDNHNESHETQRALGKAKRRKALICHL